MAFQQVATEDAVDVGQAKFAVQLMDVIQIQGDAFIITDFHVTDSENVDGKRGALQVGVAHARCDTFFLLELQVVDESGEGLGVEDGARRPRVDKEKGFLTMDRSLNHDVEALSLDVKQLQRNFDIATHWCLGWAHVIPKVLLA